MLQRNFIQDLQGDRNNWISIYYMGEIRYELFFFSFLLFPYILDEKTLYLTSLFTSDEIRLNVWKLGLWKAKDLNGIQIGIYKYLWHFIYWVENYWTGKRIVESWHPIWSSNPTNLIFIPEKLTTHITLTNFRPTTQSTRLALRFYVCGLTSSTFYNIVKLVYFSWMA